MKCPYCGSLWTEFAYTNGAQRYYRCTGGCGATFVFRIINGDVGSARHMR